MNYLGANIRAGVNSYLVGVYEDDPLHEHLDRMFKDGARLIQVWTDGKFWAEFDGTDRCKISVGKKKHMIVKLAD